jgi:CRP-like cAMP-binding protein
MSESLADIVRNLKDDIALFQKLDDHEVEQIIPYLQLACYKKGDVLFNEGDSGDFVGFIAEGALEVKKQTDYKDKKIVIALLNKGSFVGEMSLVDEKQRSATVVAVDPAEIVIFKNESLNSLVNEHPQIAIKILKGLNKVLAVRLRKAIERLTFVF